jgi:molybdopterin synthase catalytic subunit
MAAKYTLITSDPLIPEQVTAQVRVPANGGVVTFLGTAREQTLGNRVLHLEYEVYEEMAVKRFHDIFQELADRWGVTDAAIAHRYGRLEIGEISMVVAVATPHRKEAFAACWYAVDRIKEMAPIWKKEFFESGAVWVGCGEHAREVEPAHSVS